MTYSYPIVDQYEFGEPVKHGPLGVFTRRESSEIPPLKPHEVLVYRVGAKFVVDERQLRRHDDHVVRASSVSVVSVRRDTEVGVDFEIDSRDGLKFKVMVTFVCSVLDPVVVVRHGQVDASVSLLAYLKGYQDLFDVGPRYEVSQINEVRSEATLHVKAYLALRPPEIAGMEISLANVQVETPAVVTNLGQIRNEQMIQHTKQHGEAMLDAARRKHNITQVASIDEAIGGDANRAAALGLLDGGLSSQEYAAQLREQEEAREQREHEREVADRLRRYSVEDRETAWTQARQKADTEWERGELERARTEALEHRRAEIDAHLKLLEVFAERGHLDTHYEDIGDLIKRIRGEIGTAPGVPAGREQAALADGESTGSNEPEDDDNVG
jgi:hypothetical protein